MDVAVVALMLTASTCDHVSGGGGSAGSMFGHWPMGGSTNLRHLLLVFTGSAVVVLALVVLVDTVQQLQYLSDVGYASGGGGGGSGGPGQNGDGSGAVSPSPTSFVLVLVVKVVLV